MKKSDFVGLEELELVNRNFLDSKIKDTFSDPNINELDITDSQLQTILLIQMSQTIKRIKVFVLFFVVLTIISLLATIIALFL